MILILCEKNIGSSRDHGELRKSEKKIEALANPRENYLSKIKCITTKQHNNYEAGLKRI